MSRSTISRGAPSRALTPRIVVALVAVLVVGAVTLLLPGIGDEPYPLQRFHSRPDLRPPAVDVVRGDSAGSGYLFLGPKSGRGPAGPMILDRRGALVWFHPLPKRVQAFGFRPQTYRGRPVLTWWEGFPTKGHVRGVDVIADDSYREIARIQAGDGDRADLHDFTLTSRGTALVPVYHVARRDLSSVGGPRRGKVIEARIQEIDVRTKRVVFTWRSLDHIALAESYKPLPDERSQPWDYLHLNSIRVESGGNLLISARHTNAVYELDRRTGAVRWRLGGKRSSFRMGRGTRFAAQHDARLGPGGTISIFDNQAPPDSGRASRAIVLRLDRRSRTATLVHQYAHEPAVYSDSQGSVDTLADGHVFVGWGGKSPWFSEYDRSGRVVFDARFRFGPTTTYRAFLRPWRGQPRDRPALAVVAAPKAGPVAYVSWNGATDVTRWELLAGARRDALRRARIVARTGFETAIALPPGARYAAVRAVAASGARLRTSPTVAVP